MRNSSFISTIKLTFVSLIRLLSYTKGCRIRYWLGMILAASHGLLNTIVFGFSILIIFEKAMSGDIKSFLFTISAILFIVVGLVAAYALGAWMLDCGVVFTSTRIRNSIIQHLINLPSSWYDRHHSGDVMSRIINDFDEAQNALNYPLQMLINLLLSGTASIIAMFVLEWRMALVSLFISLMCMMITTRFIVPVRKISEKIQRDNSNILQIISDITSSAAILRIHGLYDFVGNMLQHRIGKAQGDELKRAKLSTSQALTDTLSIFLLYTILLGVGSFGISLRWVNLPELLAIIQLSNGPLSLFSGISQHMVELQQSLAGADRIFEILDTPQEQQGPQIVPKTDEPVIDFKNVSFSYNEEKILKEITLQIWAGQRIAIVGSSGSGKSTLLKILCRMYIPQGKAKMFGYDLALLPANALREHVAYVSQDCFLFIGTIMENIRWANPDATDEQVYQATHAANAHEFITSFPEGYNTQVGERGAQLSGGQKQRIALARAFIKNPSLILLDEPTSALDALSEEKLVDSINRLEDKTVIFATHRLSLLQKADIVMTVDNGQITKCIENSIGKYASIED